MFENSGIVSSLNQIKKNLAESLERKYGIKDEDKVNSILKIHGLHKDNFDVVRNIESFIEETNSNNVSIDDNSNKNEKTVLGVLRENTNAFDKLIGFRYLYRQMKKLYGKEQANRLTAEMYDLSLGISDSTKILLPYCWALDASKLVLMGRPFGQLQSMPPKRLVSYISALNESVHQMSNHLAGAIAISSFFLDSARVLIFEENKTIEDIKTGDVRKYVENCFQNFVHSVNHLSRSSNESPFTNLSIFDRSKLEYLLSESNMGWYFEGKNIDEVIDFIMELQNIFLDFFDKGDPSENGMPYRFPVMTLNISKNENHDLVDPKFVKEICTRDVCRYNIFVSEGTKMASCCRLLSDSEMLDIASQSNSFGGAGLSLGSHRVVTINFNRIALESNSMEDFFERLFSRTLNAGNILKAHKTLISDLEKKGLQPFISMGWVSMKRLFSTYGILGIYECQKTLVEKNLVDSEYDITKDILFKFNEYVLSISKDLGLIGNIEQIPAESFSHRLANADKIIYGDNVPYKLYANQFVPLWENASVWERMDTDGKYNKLLTGGGIVHIQISDSVTGKQAEKLIKYAVKSGCEHFALNITYSQCDHNHTYRGKISTCPECGSSNMNYFTRTVGFFTPVKSWSKIKQEEDFSKRVFIESKDI